MVGMVGMIAPVNSQAATPTPPDVLQVQHLPTQVTVSGKQTRRHGLVMPCRTLTPLVNGPDGQIAPATTVLVRGAAIPYDTGRVCGVRLSKRDQGKMRRKGVTFDVRFTVPYRITREGTSRWWGAYLGSSMQGGFKLYYSGIDYRDSAGVLVDPVTQLPATDEAGELAGIGYYVIYPSPAEPWFYSVRQSYSGSFKTTIRVRR